MTAARTTVACPMCGNLREVAHKNSKAAARRLCQPCSYRSQSIIRGGKSDPRPPHIAAARQLKVTVSQDTSKSFEPEPDFYCGEEISPNHYCRRHFPCPHHGDAA